MEYQDRYRTAKDGHSYKDFRIIKDKELERYDVKTGLWFDNNKYHDVKFTSIPCGKCIGCRLDYSRSWADRGTLELESSFQPNAWFLTTTYDNNHLPMEDEIITSDGFSFTPWDEEAWKGNLEPKHVTDFIRDLRDYFSDKFNYRGIRYMVCGEYGSQSKRPHYHWILYDCPLPIKSFYKPRVDWKKDVYWQNHIIEKFWKHGLINICEANWETIAYVARYITKKVNGEDSEYFYAAQGQIKEFFRTSRMPGIGRRYYEEHKDEIYEKDQISIKTKKGLLHNTPPLYFDKLYANENPERMEEIKEARQKKAIENLILKGQNTSLNRWEQLQVEMRTKQDKALALKRQMTEY